MERAKNYNIIKIGAEKLYYNPADPQHVALVLGVEEIMKSEQKTKSKSRSMVNLYFGSLIQINISTSNSFWE